MCRSLKDFYRRSKILHFYLLQAISRGPLAARGFRMGKGDQLLEHVLIKYRWLFVCFFLLPASFLYELWSYFRNLIVFKLSSAPGKHASKVQKVQQQVREWNKNGQQGHMCTARPGWQTMSFRQGVYKKSFYKVEVNLVDVLEIDTENNTVRVEPLVSMGQLSASLAPLGWTIPIVPEIDDLTVGGLILGTGIESSSHQFGLFQHICEEYELVLADGSLVTVTKDSDPDLFYAVPWSYGTLGFLTAAKIMIVPCTKFIKLNYKPVYSLNDAVKEFSEASASKNQFVEGIMFTLNKGVIMTGNMIDEPQPGDKVNKIGLWHKPWFFKHVESFLVTGKTASEILPLRDYYHRHTRSIFWELQDIVPFGNNRLFRLCMGWLMPPKISFLKLTQTDAVKRLYENNHIIQDMLVPITNLKESLQMFNKETKVYPIWLCPFKLPADPGMLCAPKERMFVDIGVYGVPDPSVNFKPMETTRKIEEFVQKCEGFQMLYADTYTTKEEFRRMFDHTLYDRVRSKLACTKAFPEVYDKVSRAARY
ncbi:delta(24)-sterol reductase-like isoform X1 [Cloeon dipterum]|uniref:delta(24)-sterol reductase-like isoform X1 n=1 Tax=Cloeon dipterum TaxID=197152 RepID=UPI0032204823